MVHRRQHQQKEQYMNITFTDVTSSENVLEGFDTDGNPFRIRGTLALPYFRDGKIDEGPFDLKQQHCEAVIDDTEAVLTITPNLFKFTGSKLLERT